MRPFIRRGPKCRTRRWMRSTSFGPNSMRNGIIRSSQTIAQIERLIPDGSLVRIMKPGISWTAMDAVMALYLKRDRERQLWLVQAVRLSVCYRPRSAVWAAAPKDRFGSDEDIEADPLFGAAGEPGRDAWTIALKRRARRCLRIIVEPAAGLAAQPSGLDVFHQQRAGAVLAVRQPVIQHLHDRQAGIQANEVRQFQRAHR